MQSHATFGNPSTYELTTVLLSGAMHLEPRCGRAVLGALHYLVKFGCWNVGTSHSGCERHQTNQVPSMHSCV
jgi:hypothetical protein